MKKQILFFAAVLIYSLYMTYLITITSTNTLKVIELPKPTFTIPKNAKIFVDDDDEDFQFNKNIKKVKEPNNVNNQLEPNNANNQLEPVVVKKQPLVEAEHEVHRVYKKKRKPEEDKLQWNKRSILYTTKNVECKNIIIRVPNGPQFKICLRDSRDAYTNYVQSIGKSYCRRKLLKLWNKLSSQNPRGGFMEVGAGYASCAIHMSLYNIKTYIIEASPENLNTITKSLFENREILRYISLYPFAVGEKVGRFPIYSNKFDWTSSSMMAPKDVPESQVVVNDIEMKQLDDIVSAQRLNINVLFLDASGYEYRILKGAERTLNNKCVKAFYIHIDCNKLAGFGNTPDDIFKLLESYEYIVRKRYKKSCDILSDHYIVASL